MRSLKTRHAVAILAAGKGSRMHSSLPKVLHPLAGEPMIFSILGTVLEHSPHTPIALVVGVGKELVESAVRNSPRFSHHDITFIEQKSQLGTGDAVKAVTDSKWGQEKLKKEKLPLLVLPGDQPLMSVSLMNAMTEGKLPSGLKLLTTELQDPTGYGRIVRRSGKVQKIVEEKDATASQRKIKEVGVTTYLFHPEFLLKNISKLKPKNAQKEYYITDLIELAFKSKKKVEAVCWNNGEDLSQVNTPWQLAEARKLLNQRILKKWAEKGVQFHDIDQTWIDRSVELAEGVEVFAGVELYGKTKIARDTRIESRVYLRDVVVASKAHIKVGTVAEQSQIDEGAQVGPYARLRPQSSVGKDSKIGNFVELKKTSIGERTSVSHLSYLGDAKVGNDCNIGCGFITCNFDGRVRNGQRKHPTLIEDHVFMGSDCQVIAPIHIKKNSYIASGSTINKNVEEGDLAIARTKQVNKQGYAKRLLAMTEKKEN